MERFHERKVKLLSFWIFLDGWRNGRKLSNE